MSHEPTTLVQIRQTNGVAIVAFLTPYLQTEEVIQSIVTDWNKLVDDEGVTKILLSFQGVRFLSSSMLAQMVKLQKKLSKVKGQVRVSTLPPAMKEVMRVSQLDKMIEVFDDETTALDGF